MKASVVLIFSLCALSCIQAQQAQPVLIAAASDLKFALDSAIAVFKQRRPEARIDVAYGSSGKLFEQISHAAPFDLFFSADIQYPLELQKNDLTYSEVQTYAIGRIVIWSQRIDPRPEGINVLLNPAIRKIAIANPMHAPYGRRAEEALKYEKVYEKIKTKLVLGENVSQTAQFITTGAADAGIIALSLALSPTMKKLPGYYYLIPENMHQPLEQGFVILRHAMRNPTAREFGDFIISDQGVDILRSFGFDKKR